MHYAMEKVLVKKFKFKHLECKYDSQRGFDALYVKMTKDGKIDKIIFAESKASSKDAVHGLSKDAKGIMQLSKEHLKKVLDKLVRNNPATREICQKILKSFETNPSLSHVTRLVSKTNGSGWTQWYEAIGGIIDNKVTLKAISDEYKLIQSASNTLTLRRRMDKSAIALAGAASSADALEMSLDISAPSDEEMERLRLIDNEYEKNSDTFTKGKEERQLEDHDHLALQDYAMQRQMDMQDQAMQGLMDMQDQAMKELMDMQDQAMQMHAFSAQAMSSSVENSNKFSRKEDLNQKPCQIKEKDSLSDKSDSLTLFGEINPSLEQLKEMFEIFNNAESLPPHWSSLLPNGPQDLSTSLEALNFASQFIGSTATSARPGAMNNKVSFNNYANSQPGTMPIQAPVLTFSNGAVFNSGSPTFSTDSNAIKIDNSVFKRKD